MKAICIKKCIGYDGIKPFHASPEKGEIVEVIKTTERENSVWYGLYEYPGFLYSAYNFVILPEPSTDDMQEVEKEAILNLETV